MLWCHRHSVQACRRAAHCRLHTCGRGIERRRHPLDMVMVGCAHRVTRRSPDHRHHRLCSLAHGVEEQPPLIVSVVVAKRIRERYRIIGRRTRSVKIQPYHSRRHEEPPQAAEANFGPQVRSLTVRNRTDRIFDFTATFRNRTDRTPGARTRFLKLHPLLYGDDSIAPDFPDSMHPLAVMT